MNVPVVDMQGIIQEFPGVRALDDVDFDLQAGEIHALLGENGAGKSTLMKILAGVLPAERGTIRVDGSVVRISNPRRAQRLGIGMVFQESSLAPYLTVAQNIFTMHEPRHMGLIVDRAKEVQEAGSLLRQLSIDIDPNELVARLSLGKQQLVAFARALSFRPRVIILDEPTSSLTTQQTELMFDALKGLKREGVGVVYISHRLDEVYQLCDRVTVLRDGRKVDTLALENTNMGALIRMMVGRDISEMYPKERTQIGEEALRLEDFTREGVCEAVNLSVRKGEVVGLFGLVGAGRTELMRLAWGLEVPGRGTLHLFGKSHSRLSPSEAVDLGMGFSPEDRKQEGLCLALSVKENIVRASLDRLFPSGFISGKREKAVARKYIGELAISTPSEDRPAMYLSGGTQQKVVLAHWLCAGSTVLVLDEPTRGIDVGAKVEIYRMINQLAKSGAAILLISSELPEILGITDRVYVMRRGRIVGEVNTPDATPEQVAAYAFGAREAHDAATN